MLWRTEGEGLAGRAGCGPGQPLPRGGKAGGRAPGPPARSLCSFARSLPPAGGLVVSQSVRLQPAGPASRRGPSPRTPAPSPAIVRLAAAAAGARSPGPRTTGEARLWRRASGTGVGGWGARSCPRGDGPGGRGGAPASLSPAPPQARAGGRGLHGLRKALSASRRPKAWSRDAVGLRGK